MFRYASRSIDCGVIGESNTLITLSCPRILIIKLLLMIILVIWYALVTESTKYIRKWFRFVHIHSDAAIDTHTYTRQGVTHSIGQEPEEGPGVSGIPPAITPQPPSLLPRYCMSSDVCWIDFHCTLCSIWGSRALQKHTRLQVDGRPESDEHQTFMLMTDLLVPLSVWSPRPVVVLLDG